MNNSIKRKIGTCFKKMFKEKEIINLYSDTTNDGGTGLGKGSLTAKFSKYNIFALRFA